MVIGPAHLVQMGKRAAIAKFLARRDKERWYPLAQLSCRHGNSNIGQFEIAGRLVANASVWHCSRPTPRFTLWYADASTSPLALLKTGCSHVFATVFSPASRGGCGRHADLQAPTPLPPTLARGVVRGTQHPQLLMPRWWPQERDAEIRCRVSVCAHTGDICFSRFLGHGFPFEVTQCLRAVHVV
jgi:hypothetical protein